MTEDRHGMFRERYAAGETPWDSGITPPEIMEILGEMPAGAALDLGCGTGTVIHDLLRRGWRADGVDFVQRAIDLAGEKLAEYPADTHNLFCHDVTRLDDLPGLRTEYDLIIDIGCGHCIDASAIEHYAAGVTSRLRIGGLFMLYASHPRLESSVGWSPKLVERVFGDALELVWEQRGDDVAIGAPASWYRMRRPGK